MSPGSIHSLLLAPSVPDSTLPLLEWYPVSGHAPSSEALHIPDCLQLSKHHGPILNSMQASADSHYAWPCFRSFFFYPFYPTHSQQRNEMGVPLPPSLKRCTGCQEQSLLSSLVPTHRPSCSCSGNPSPTLHSLSSSGRLSHETSSTAGISPTKMSMTSHLAAPTGILRTRLSPQITPAQVCSPGHHSPNPAKVTDLDYRQEY